MKEIIEALQRRAQAELGENSWEGYAEFLMYLSEATARVPSTAAIADMGLDRIDEIFTAEVDCLAIAVMKIFPRGGLAEFSTYLPRQE